MSEQYLMEAKQREERILSFLPQFEVIYDQESYSYVIHFVHQYGGTSHNTIVLSRHNLPDDILDKDLIELCNLISINQFQSAIESSEFKRKDHESKT